jgi:hypothetical protein
MEGRSGCNTRQDHCCNIFYTRILSSSFRGPLGVFRRNGKSFVIFFWTILFPYLKFNSAVDATLLRLGFLPPGPFLPFDIRSYSAHFVTPILFLGPLFGSYLAGQLPGQKNWTWNTHVYLRFFSIQGIRNYCVVSLGQCFRYFLISRSLCCISGTHHGRNCFSCLCSCDMSPCWHIQKANDFFSPISFWTR